jgi:hypothetical protein
MQIVGYKIKWRVNKIPERVWVNTVGYILLLGAIYLKVSYLNKNYNILFFMIYLLGLCLIIYSWAIQVFKIVKEK